MRYIESIATIAQHYKGAIFSILSGAVLHSVMCIIRTVLHPHLQDLFKPTLLRSSIGAPMLERCISNKDEAKGN